MAWAVRIALTLGSGMLVAGCLNLGAYTCSDNMQCRIGDEAGVCQPSTGFCSYPDVMCSTGFRYGEDAGDGLSGECVGDDMGTTTIPPTTTEPDESSTTEEPDSSSTSGPPPTTIDPSTSGSDSSSETGDTCGSLGQACCAGACDDGLGCFGDTCGCIADIAAGDNHNCVVRTDGSVLCWGDNSTGQLGAVAIGTSSATPVAAAELLLGPGTGAVEIDASGGHTCVVREDGQAVCWGENDSGASIPGMPALAPGTPAAPTLISNAMDFTMPALGTGFSCLGRSIGVLATCFGVNNLGQLTGAETPGPVDVAAVFTFDEIDAGARHVCGRTATGDMYCWGDNADGQLAVNPVSVPSSTTVRQIIVPPAGDIAIGRAHSCIRTSNEVQCWGDGAMGQLGDGLATDSVSPVTVSSLPVAPIQALTSAADTVCAKQADATYCWGDNTGLKLLQTTIETYSPVPLALNILDEASAPIPIDQVVHGSGHGCALTDTHEVRCWGLNAMGQVGNGIPSAQVFTPEVVNISCG